MSLAARLAPTRTELVPWTDRRGRFHPMRATVFALLLLPASWLGARAVAGALGAEPLNAAIHSTGFWAVWLLLVSLAVTPARALGSEPNLVVVRRMIGNAALAYALLHLVLYATDQKWVLGTIAGEILKRLYLTIGFVALLGLCVLGFTSTGGWIRSLGRGWKRLHRIVYGIMALGLVHYLLQTKLDVSLPLLAAGLFTWAMLWRVLPVGRDREWLPLIGIALLSAALTLAYEYLWYRFGTKVDPMRVLRGELDVRFGLRPAGQVLALTLLATVLAEVRRLDLGRAGDTAWFTVGLFAAGGLTGYVATWLTGWSVDGAVPWDLPPALFWAGWTAALGALGAARWLLRDTPRRRLLDAVCVLAIAAQLGLLGTSMPWLAAAFTGLSAVVSVAAAARILPQSRRAAMLVLPLTLLSGGLGAGLATLS